MFTLHLLDWIIIISYLTFSLLIGLYFRKLAGQDRISYFLAGRSLPWWLVGASMAATTFAADTPLAVTGIIAQKGISGNWLWMPMLGVHAAFFAFFAVNWSRSGVVTDAELINIRYSGKSAYFLRWCRAILQLITNCIILGWVLNAMVKIASPFFNWQTWFPSLLNFLNNYWPENSTLGSVSDSLTIITLLILVGIYSSLGGLRGVIFTDFIQLLLALAGSTLLAWSAWQTRSACPWSRSRSRRSARRPPRRAGCSWRRPSRTPAP